MFMNIEHTKIPFVCVPWEDNA